MRDCRGTVVTSIRLSVELLAILDDEAARSRRSRNSMIEVILEEWILKHNIQVTQHEGETSPLVVEWDGVPANLIKMLTAYAMPNDYTGSIVSELLDHSLVAPTRGGSYEATERGSKFVQMLRQVPLPEMRWVDPRIERKS